MGKGLCPYCGSPNLSYNPRFKSWRCNRCEKSFPIPSYGTDGPERNYGTPYSSRRTYIAPHHRHCRCAECRPKRSPSFQLKSMIKLVVVIGLIGAVVASFDGVEPFNGWKSNIGTFINQISSSVSTTSTTTPDGQSQNTSTTTHPVTQTQQTQTTGINSKTGVYGDYNLGLIKESSGVQTNSYGDFTVLINNRNAKDVTYQELLNFLRADNTDSFPYTTVFIPLLPYYGTAESHVDLASIKGIIDGTLTPKPPRICADFAQMLHNNAEKAGIRCAYVTIDLTDSSGKQGHALNAFQTTDRGLVYVDDTGLLGAGPSNADKVVSLKAGSSYVPQSLFPSADWSSTWDDMGIASDIFMTWDGSWNN